MAGGIILQWRDRNFAENGHRVYRSNTPMSLSSMPTPIATLDKNVTEYIDYDVIEGNTYYYRISAVRGNDEAISDELMMVAEEIKNGPGPEELIGGDMTAGFFGEVDSSLMITGDDLATQLGITQGTSQYSTEPWLKFALDGEIVFVNKKPIRHNISWEHIYQAGAVYGTDDFGYNPSGGDRLQDARVTIDGFEFKVTLLKGANSDPTGTDDTGYDIPLTHNSEWNRLMYPIHQGSGYQSNAYSLTPSTQFNQWASYSDDDLIVDYRAGDGSRCWTQETHGSSTSNRLTRGLTGVTYALGHSSTSPLSNVGLRAALRLVR